MEEIWKDLPNYEGLYQVSNLGRVKSLNYKNTKKERILNPSKNNTGYYQTRVYKDGKYLTIKIHQLVAMTFLNHIPCGYKLVVDHINDNHTDNRLENLQIVTQRYNACKSQGKYSSQYKGVSWCKSRQKWEANIKIDNKKKHLGRYKNEYDAHLAYQKALSEIEKTPFC